MSSLLTNSSAMTALQTLSMTNKNMATTQNRISTGLRVGGAEDNAAYWSIATTMRSDNMALSAVNDSLGLGAAVVDTMYTSMNSTVDVLNEIKAKLTTASGAGVDRAKIQSDIDQLQDQLGTIASSAVFNGESWLQEDSTTANATKSVIASFSRDAAGLFTLDSIDIDVTDIRLFDSGADTGLMDRDYTAGGTTVAIEDIDVSALTDSAADRTTIQETIAVVDLAIAAVTDAATDLGSVKKRVDLQQTFVSNLTDAVDRGIGQLVDADMNKESTRLQALQTQQQLGIQALSIANQGAQNILSLFR
ncbi:flagellin [Roseibium alexandrii]|uniref:flagellin N-terminal helical domain-containing protein n=1 Tax=Roseibium alexandrii TaxID=388408 RepID=UPI003752B8E1